MRGGAWQMSGGGVVEVEASYWVLVIMVGAVLLYGAAWLAGIGFGRGFFNRKMKYNDEFLSKLENRSTDNGTEG